MPEFRERHPRITLEVVVKEHVIDFVAEGFDATFEVAEFIARDMVQVRLTEPFKFFAVGSPDYLKKHGTPRKPEDLLQHDCMTFRWPTNAALYPWEFQRGRRTWRVPVRGSIITNSFSFCVAMAVQGQGLAYVADVSVQDELNDGRLVPLLESYAAAEPGIFLCYPNRSQRSPALQSFVETAKQVLRRK